MAELLEALPNDLDEQSSDQFVGAPPVGRWTRMGAMTGLSARLALAYLAWWLKSWFQGRADSEEQLRLTHIDSAMRLFSTMGYLRGAAMKAGQLIATYPNVLPEEFTDVIGRLHFQAPPMHPALVREVILRDFNRPPEEMFDDFEPVPFAAASLGQVHRANLKSTGQPIAIKVQYPDIGRVVRDDFRNLRALAAPMRLSSDWDNVLEQLDDILSMLDAETDYESEAANLELARKAFHETEEIDVPRVHREFSTRRVLTMDFIDGVHLVEFLESNPAQEVRDRHGHQMTLVSFRLSYGSHLVYADPHPGNYIFQPNGRLGLIDFGCCRRYTTEDVDYLTQVERGFLSDEATFDAAMARAADLTPRQRAEQRRMELYREWSKWLWEPIRHSGPFDFGDESYFRRGMELYREIMERRYVRSLPVNLWITKSFVGVRAMLTRLRARVDFGAIHAAETTVRN